MGISPREEENDLPFLSREASNRSFTDEDDLGDTTPTSGEENDIRPKRKKKWRWRWRLRKITNEFPFMCTLIGNILGCVTIMALALIEKFYWQVDMSSRPPPLDCLFSSSPSSLCPDSIFIALSDTTFAICTAISLGFAGSLANMSAFIAESTSTASQMRCHGMLYACGSVVLSLLLLLSLNMVFLFIKSHS